MNIPASIIEPAVGADLARPFALEICASSARLTAALLEAGFEAKGIDYAGNKDVPVAPVVLLDLTSTDGQHRPAQLVRHPRLAYVHFAPPCGTASRARERRIPGLAGGGPAPLRSTQFPLGLPNLEADMPRAFRRVMTANVIYELVSRLAAELIARKVPWTIENPEESLFWYLVDVIALLGPDVQDVFFQY